MLLLMCDKVSKEAAASYLVQVESSYHLFDKSAQEFVQVHSYYWFQERHMRQSFLKMKQLSTWLFSYLFQSLLSL